MNLCLPFFEMAFQFYLEFGERLPALVAGKKLKCGQNLYHLAFTSEGVMSHFSELSVEKFGAEVCENDGNFRVFKGLL